MEATYYTVNEIQLHVMEAGPANGPVILFLHGFPEFWYGWKHQIDFFAHQGYRVIAPDQRGYNKSDKPKDTQAYAMEFPMHDMVELIQQVAKEPIKVVGHDWGGAVAWALGMHHPELVAKLCILNMPHPEVMHRTLKTNPKQMLKSWYVGFFQLPFLPELLDSAFDFRFLEKTLTNTSTPGAFTPEDITLYKEAWQQPEALTGMINWYRAYKYSELDITLPATVPTLLLWGKQDSFLSSEMAKPSVAKCAPGNLVFLEEATHWLHHEQPQKVNSLLLEFLSAHI